ncbi:hypothetical protein HLRTI_001514 [Halorhabdus tiamatea SARL4B]|uniref:DUF8125 domain-containing protein n=1 Tax=Halorhabdus tiamatea SARL4B TaxID=1033806 RepID=F7PFL6_9EURY|nr:hypothetical protein [Halorhabdus tiamatea]ERJ06435.1 hypothetical protein HLRTI_001514 [Halorhabdus tiamatea SARL4B]CCQ34325.1 hypothetical protein HTIA_2213 [Halorhabdus tiamatea SARL4B]
MTDSKNPLVDDSRPAWLELAIAYRYWIGGGLTVTFLTLLLGVVVFGLELPEISLNQPTKVFLFGGLLAAISGALPAAKIIDWLYDPPKRYVVSLGLKKSETPAIYELTPTAWESVWVEEGDLYQWENTNHPVYEAESFDPENLIAEGTWRGSKSDRELLRAEKKVEELREEIEKEADMSIDLELSIASRVRKATKAIGQVIIEDYAATSTYEGERVRDVLSDLRQDVEDDTGDGPHTTGEKPVVGETELEAAVDGLQAAAAEARPDGGEESG